MGLFSWIRRRKLPSGPPPTTREILAQFRLGGGVRCQTCRYQLTGLPPNTKCPECGRPTLLSKLYYLADQTGRSVDTFLFLIDAMKRTNAVSHPGEPLKHITARQFCNAVRDDALEQAGNEPQARELLHEMGILRSEELGALLYAMAEMGLFAVSENDVPEDFDGLSEVLNAERVRE